MTAAAVLLVSIPSLGAQTPKSDHETDALATAIFVGGPEVLTGWVLAADAPRREGASWPEGVERICIIQPDGIYHIRKNGVERLER